MLQAVISEGFYQKFDFLECCFSFAECTEGEKLMKFKIILMLEAISSAYARWKCELQSLQIWNFHGF